MNTTYTLNPVYKEPQTIFKRLIGKWWTFHKRRNHFKSYIEFKKAQKKYEMGQFFTPDHICELIVKILEIEKGSIVADICSGKWSFFNYLDWCELHGVEKDLKVFWISQKLFPKANIQHSDMKDMKPITNCDYIVWNPPFWLDIDDINHPFAIRWIVFSQSYYLYKSWENLKYDGFMWVVFPYYKTPFLRTASRKVIDFFWKHFKVWGFINLPKWTFKTTNIQTKILILQKKKFLNPRLNKQNDFFKINYLNNDQVLDEWKKSKFYKDYID